MNQITLEEQLAEEMNQLFGGTAEPQTEEQKKENALRELYTEMLPAMERIGNRELDKIRESLGMNEEDYNKHHRTWNFDFVTYEGLQAFSDRVKTSANFTKDFIGDFQPFTSCFVTAFLTVCPPANNKGGDKCGVLEIRYRFALNTVGLGFYRATRIKEYTYSDIYYEVERHKQEQLDKL